MKPFPARAAFPVLMILVLNCFQSVASGGYSHVTDTLKSRFSTWDGLVLPAQVIRPANNSGKVLLFINGSTPSDEKGYLGANWDSKGRMISAKQDFYYRFISVMAMKGFTVATMAKRSYVYPTRIPRPSFADLTLDVIYYINELKRTGIIGSMDDLVLVGYSEGSIVASKVLGMLKDQPSACVLLGSAASLCDCSTMSIDNFGKSDVYRKLKKLTDEQLLTEMKQLCAIQEELEAMDETEFENEYKKSKPYGFGFADWESYYIDKETKTYDPVSNLVYAGIPLLMCIGEDDQAMPVKTGHYVYDRLRNAGFDKITFRIIPGEVHSYKKHDVFAIIAAWLGSGMTCTDFTFDATDSLIIAEAARASKLTDLLSAIPYGGGYEKQVMECYRMACEGYPLESNGWWSMALKLFADNRTKEAFTAFERAASDTASISRFGSYVWMGHIRDMQDRRKEALKYYETALALFPGFPIQHDNWKIVIDEAWIRERLRTPFRGIQK